MATVVIKECKSYDVSRIQEAIENAIALLGGWDKYVVPGNKVLLKPNLIAPRHPEEAATTHPEILRALIRILRARGCSVMVGDSAGGAIAGLAPTAQALKVSGYAKMCEEEGAQCVNFDREGTISVPSRTRHVGNEFHIARPVLEADVVINVPKLKTHSASGYTGAVKNTFGCIPGLRKASYHKHAPDLGTFTEVLADIHLACRVRLNIMDAIVGMEGAGPTNGHPKQAGLILVSDDALALDTVGAQVIGLEPDKLEFIRSAASLGVGEADPSRINLLGDFADIPKRPFALPATFGRSRRMPRWVLPAVVNLLQTRPVINRNQCRKCGVCRESCPVQAISQDIHIDESKCIECLCCQELCPRGAVFLQRRNPVFRFLMPVKCTEAKLQR